MTIDDLPIQMVKITGTPGNGFWSQIHTFTPDEPEKIVLRGTLLASLMVKTDKQGVEAVSYGRDILGRLHEEYFGNPDGAAFDCLNRAAERVLVESPESQVAIAVILDKKIILAVSPGATVWFKRSNDFGQLLASENGIEMLSGKLVENDTYLLSSSVFNQAIPVGTLKIALGVDLEQAGEMIGPIVLGHERSGGAVGLFFRVNEFPAVGQPVELEKATTFGQTGGSITVSPVVATIVDRPVKTIYLKSARLRQTVRKFLPYIGILLAVFLVILVVSKVIGGISQSRREAKGKVLISALQTKVEAGIKLMESDPAGITELVTELDNDVKVIDQQKLQETQEYAGIKKQIDRLKNESNQVGFIKEPTVYMDLGLVENGVEGKKLTISGKQMIILTNDGKSVIIFDITKKAYKKYDTEKSYSLLASDNNKVYLGSENETAEVDPGNGKVKTLVTDGGWSLADGLAVYSGNAYVLDTKKSSIWRFPAIEGGLGIGSNWLKETVDLGKSIGLAVDGSVWLLDKDRIRKFSLGKEASFTVSDEKFKLTDAGFVWTNSETKELLVVDKNNGRLYRIGKDGKLVKSYQSSVFKSTISLTSDGKKAYLLDGKKIYEVGLE